MKKTLESPENKKCIKAINFDLETKRVKEIFHSNSPYIYLKAYQLNGGINYVQNHFNS